jgi:hypothetical protein
VLGSKACTTMPGPRTSFYMRKEEQCFGNSKTRKQNNNNRSLQLYNVFTGLFLLCKILMTIPWVLNKAIILLMQNFRRNTCLILKDSICMKMTTWVIIMDRKRGE